MTVFATQTAIRLQFYTILKLTHYHWVSDFQHICHEHFAHTSATWKIQTQHSSLRSQEGQQLKNLKAWSVHFFFGTTSQEEITSRLWRHQSVEPQCPIHQQANWPAIVIGNSIHNTQWLYHLNRILCPYNSCTILKFTHYHIQYNFNFVVPCSLHCQSAYLICMHQSLKFKILCYVQCSKFFL